MKDGTTSENGNTMGKRNVKICEVFGCLKICFHTLKEILFAIRYVSFWPIFFYNHLSVIFAFIK